MIILLEGPDGSGKSVLARAFMTAWGESGRYLHDRFHGERQFLYDTAMLRQAVKNQLNGLHTVLDRHWIGDNIYGSVFRQGGALWVRRIDSVLQRYGAGYILCIPAVDKHEETFQHLRTVREEKFKTMREVTCRYHDLWHGNVLRPFDGDYVEQQSHMSPWSGYSPRCVWSYDRYELPLDKVYHWIKKDVLPVLKHEQHVSEAADPLPRGLTSWELSGSLKHARALLVGERAKHLDAPVNWPFYSDKNSAEYLTKSLHRAKICETHIALTNAYSVEAGASRDHCMMIIRWLRQNRPEVKIIALGREAERVIKYQGHRVDACLPHPQWARRFDHNGDYHRLLDRAVYS